MSFSDYLSLVEMFVIPVAESLYRLQPFIPLVFWAR